MEGKSKQFGLIPREKIFGIGIGKTGTHSLTIAVRMLGYPKAHHGKGAANLERIRSWNFWADIPVAGKYKFLDHCFPHAKFILTVRDINSWIRSCRGYSFKKGGDKAREEIDHMLDGIIWTKLDRAYTRFLVYGCVNFNEEAYLTAYYKHKSEVKAHFRGREDKLLIMDICAGDGWEKLCPFLGCDIPDKPFPHVNKQSYAPAEEDHDAEEEDKEGS